MDSSLESIPRRTANSKWLSAHYSSLAKKHKEEWIAVLDGSVVAHDVNLPRLSKQLRNRYKKTYGEIAFEFVTEKPAELIL
jgi:hypothetical protein